MPESNLHKLSALGQSVWIDYLSRQMLQSGRARADDGRGRRRRRHVEPDDLPEGDLARATAYDEQLRELLESGETDPKEIFLQLSSHDIARRLRPAAPGLGRGERPRRLRLVGGRPDARLRPRRHDRARRTRLHDWIDKPNLYVKIPATEPGLGAIEEMIAAGADDQRDADLLARAPHGGHGGVHPRPRAARRGWRRSDARCTRSRASSSRASTPRRTSGSTSSAATRRSCKGKLAIANAKLAYQNYLEVFSGAALGGARRRRARRSSAACGRRRRRRTPTTATSCTSRS